MVRTRWMRPGLSDSSVSRLSMAGLGLTQINIASLRLRRMRRSRQRLLEPGMSRGKLCINGLDVARAFAGKPIFQGSASAANKGDHSSLPYSASAQHTRKSRARLGRKFQRIHKHRITNAFGQVDEREGCRVRCSPKQDERLRTKVDSLGCCQAG